MIFNFSPEENIGVKEIETFYVSTSSSYSYSCTTHKGSIPSLMPLIPYNSNPTISSNIELDKNILVNDNLCRPKMDKKINIQNYISITSGRCIFHGCSHGYIMDTEKVSCGTKFYIVIPHNELDNATIILK